MGLIFNFQFCNFHPPAGGSIFQFSNEEIELFAFILTEGNIEKGTNRIRVYKSPKRWGNERLKEIFSKMNIDFKLIQQQWNEKVNTIFEEATLAFPNKTFSQTGGKTGTHTEHLGYILAEMQYLQRSYPNAQW